MKIQLLIDEIKEHPDRKDVLILNRVLEMVGRKDSKETIFETAAFLGNISLLNHALPEVKHD